MWTQSPVPAMVTSFLALLPLSETIQNHYFKHLVLQPQSLLSSYDPLTSTRPLAHGPLHLDCKPSDQTLALCSSSFSLYSMVHLFNNPPVNNVNSLVCWSQQYSKTPNLEEPNYPLSMQLKKSLKKTDWYNYKFTITVLMITVLVITVLLGLP